VPSSLEELHGLRDLAALAAEGLRRGQIAAVGEAMKDSWALKRKLASGVTNEAIDRAVDIAVEAGATGAKVTGAGGGGFLLVICPPENQTAVRRNLSHMRELPVRLDRLGSRVVFNVLRDIWS
jgi:D-glycero-alpha-D-manno-heptose-7-phosphate kinase